MKNNYTFIIIFSSLICVSKSTAQNNNVGIGTLVPDSSAVLDLTATDKGILVPRLTSAQRLSVTNPANGLLVFDTDSSCFFFYRASSSAWISLCNGGTNLSPTTTLYSDFVPSANVANISEQVLKSWTLPANTLTSNGSWIEIEVILIDSTPLNNGVFKIKIGGVNILNAGPYNSSLVTIVS